MFIDTHAHLTDKAFYGKEMEFITKAEEMKVEKVITSGFDLTSSLQALNLASQYENVYASCGVYPCEADKTDKDWLEKLEQICKNNKVVAIGEIGLEFRENSPSREVQERVFIEQIKLAHKLKLPIIIHCREAIGATLDILNEHKHLLTFGGTFHCFGQGKEVASQILKLGFHISLGGVSTFKNAKAVKEAISFIPLEKILLETDCPYLAPEPFRGKLNHPALIPYIAENIAVIKGVQVCEVERQTTLNARRLFNI